MRYSIGQVVSRTGIGEATLRMWEQRYGFPEPERTASGHRRYSELQLEQIARAAAAREAGLSPRAAIERARAAQSDTSFSLFATLRTRRPELEPRLLRKRLMLALSHAIEDESLARAERQLLFGCFQRERFYRPEQRRWRQLAQGAALAVVFADFDHPSAGPDGPVEIPVRRDHPLAREWALVSDSDTYAVCLVGREPPSSDPAGPSIERVFEAIWSVEPDVVREAARICAEVASQTLPEALGATSERLQSEPGLATREQLRLATSVTNRMLSSLQ
jgi:DICT domain-containing protein